MASHGTLPLCVSIWLTIIHLAYSDDVASAFENSKLVPDVTPCAPQYELQVTYPRGNVYPGKMLSPTEVALAPKVQFNASSSTYYTLIMTDPDVPLLGTAAGKDFNHWIVVNIQGDNTESGETVAQYLSPTPPPLTGPHRYTFLVYQQKGMMNFNETEGIAVKPARLVPVSDFVNKYGLGCPVFGNYFLGAAEYLLGTD